MREKQKVESKKQRVESLKPKAKEKKEVVGKASRNEPAPEENSDPADNSFDFGGLPERNLKKNLGC